TVFVGSMLAYREPLLKKRLAWSTVSQVSYILFGIFLMHPVALVGALLQLVYHAAAKNGLFLSAGAIIFETGDTQVAQLRGVGRRMPLILGCFTVCALSLVGIPPMGGFISKWYLILGALDAASSVGFIGAIILLISAILTAGYLLPIVRDAFFPGKDFPKPQPLHPSPYMTVPIVCFSLIVVLLGLFPAPLVSFIETLAIF
ncbi:MAG: proton-conducting transporter membrane subunit, partial [Oscillospiraceae bacterium]|nr:proton-conducting transporter membrane subunit [Oscillospiraceae bacterium]